MGTWDPGQYSRFRAEREQPFWDLLALVQPRPGMRAVDLGCGGGEQTAALHQRLQAAETLGIDSSAAMLEKAAAHAGEGLRFERGDIAAFAVRSSYDLVFSNAALHWIDDHGALFQRLRDALAEGGQLAVQMPANSGHSSHRVAAAVAAEAPFREALAGWERRDPVLAPEAYATLLHRLGFREQQVRLQIYAHLLPSRDEVVEWVKGALLTEYRARLGEALFEGFLARYREKLLPLLEQERPYLYTYPRVLVFGRL